MRTTKLPSLDITERTQVLAFECVRRIKMGNVILTPRFRIMVHILRRRGSAGIEVVETFAKPPPRHHDLSRHRLCLDWAAANTSLYLKDAISQHPKVQHASSSQFCAVLEHIRPSPAFLNPQPHPVHIPFYIAETPRHVSNGDPNTSKTRPRFKKRQRLRCPADNFSKTLPASRTCRDPSSPRQALCPDPKSTPSVRPKTG